MSEKPPIAAVVGMAGAGKSSACAFLQENGFTVLRFGDETDSGLKELGLALTEKNERQYRENLRKKLGMAAYGIKIKPRVEAALKQGKKIVLDGLYSWEEYLYLKNSFKQLILLAVYAQKNIRYQRINRRTERSLTKKQAEQRDIAELINLHKGAPIAFADYLVVNNSSLAKLNGELAKFLKLLV